MVPRQLIRALAGLERPVVIGHVTPDADCLGSMLAVAATWPAPPAERPGVCLPEGSVSQRLAFLVEMTAARVVGPEALPAADGFVVVDTAAKPRCNLGSGVPESWSDGRPVLNIDHHETNTRFGEVNWVVPQASSTAELVYQAIVASGRRMSPEIASVLYAGIHADTRAFTVSTASAGTLGVAAALVDRGADVVRIGEGLYRSQALQEFELLRTVYANTRLAADGRIAYSTVAREEFASCGCRAEDIDEQVDVPRSLRGAQVAVLLSEGVPGRVRVNLRGAAGVSVLSLARELGGGGHDQAAGVTLACGLTEAVRRVLGAAQRHLPALPGGSRPPGDEAEGGAPGGP